MEVTRHFLTRRNGIEQFGSGILGMGSHKANGEVTLNGVDTAKQLGKIDAMTLPFSVGIHVLSQQSNLFIARRNQFTSFFENNLRVATALTATDVGHDAVGAEIIATIHNGQPSFETAVTDHGNTLGDHAVLLRSDR